MPTPLREVSINCDGQSIYCLAVQPPLLKVQLQGSALQRKRGQVDEKRERMNRDIENRQQCSCRQCQDIGPEEISNVSYPSRNEGNIPQPTEVESYKEVVTCLMNKRSYDEWKQEMAPLAFCGATEEGGG